MLAVLIGRPKRLFVISACTFSTANIVFSVNRTVSHPNRMAGMAILFHVARVVSTTSGPLLPMWWHANLYLCAVLIHFCCFFLQVSVTERKDSNPKYLYWSTCRRESVTSPSSSNISHVSTSGEMTSLFLRLYLSPRAAHHSVT